ncbi:class I SAM-dependent methyltransferase [Chryseobacterium suipulveris]|uniref:Class I SAM-dependent methyltransferase n=1 Tax=Chryseobacterium suipulveris TaxID=2929800 RepID=A0ABY4BQ65_9FLAO|nr:methyltransferase domain-containing protein [Chryseobacterium suipulveris]UOE41348.1 class I SAM-dependent methyltransferase [Chryseobacterium suipulveris]
MNSFTLIAKKYTPTKFRIFLREIKWKLLYYFQSILKLRVKKSFYCPVNEKYYRTFIQYKNLTISPDLGARERHRFIWHYIKNQTNLLIGTKKIKLLHISPEYCFYQNFRKHVHIDYYPVDKFEPGYDYLNLTRNFDLLDNHLPKNEYDFILCNHVLEHIIDDKKAIRNLFSLLKNEGKAIVSVPILHDQLTFEDYSITSPKLRKLYFGQWDHVRYYGIDIVERFKEVGFSVKTIISQEYFSENERLTFGIGINSYLFELSKTQ